MPAKKYKKSSKADSLLAEGTFNASSKNVRDPKFREDDFFDPRDLVQVKYEMLRRVHTENATVTDAAMEYGFSRPAYYQANANFEKAGVLGLVPKKRGPHGPHKINAEVLAFLKKQVIDGQPIRARKLAILVRQRFGIKIHPRTIERVLGGKKTQF